MREMRAGRYDRRKTTSERDGNGSLGARRRTRERSRGLRDNAFQWSGMTIVA
jgi:hypothetical protein